MAGDDVFYKDGMDKKWTGPVKVLEQAKNSEIKLDIPESNGGFKLQKRKWILPGSNQWCLYSAE